MGSVDSNLRIPLGITVFVGFLLGMLAMFFVAGVFGFSAPIAWPVVVVLFLFVVFFLERPKTYLFVMFLFFGLYYNFRMLNGPRVIPIYLPFEQMLDELFMIVPIGVIILRVTQHRQPPGATWFPLLYVVLVLISRQYNQVPLMPFLQASLSYFKFYILWYFVRCIGPWTVKDFKWILGLIAGFAFLQFALNVSLWQRSFVVHINPDFSTGTVGNAHFCGYICAIALLLMGGWMLTQKTWFTWSVIFVAGISLAAAYNLIFLTDTKHALILIPFVVAPLLFYRRIPVRNRVLLVIVGLLFVLAVYAYFVVAKVFQVYHDISFTWDQIRWGGKGAVFRAITTDFVRHIGFWLFGMGPGNFCSSNALYAMRPLAMKYVLPYTPWAYGGFQSASATMVGTPSCGYFTLFGEFGPALAIGYIAIWLHFILHLWRLAQARVDDLFVCVLRISTACSLIFFLALNLVYELFNIQILVLPLMTLTGALWDVSSLTAHHVRNKPSVGDHSLE
ncbi:MAG TPA: hypothetical protein DCZ95_01500 [Verrucomicrobia bacterium]|nr:MAG: hypothetical protein A2X46_08765 [Lentisphaerae bacterium GWF2_57_35]HBA82744.1 hypothetical protein [Verrucomicrobiota bacterium]